jgi:hypothetical protein
LLRSKKAKIAALAAFLALTGFVFAQAWFSNKEIKELFIDLAGPLQISVSEEKAFYLEISDKADSKLKLTNNMLTLPSDIKQTITVTNFEDDAYLRLGVVAEWRDEKDQPVLGDLPARVLLANATTSVDSIVTITPTATPTATPIATPTSFPTNAHAIFQLAITDVPIYWKDVAKPIGEYETFMYLLDASPTPALVSAPVTPVPLVDSQLGILPEKSEIEFTLTLNSGAYDLIVPKGAKYLKLVILPEAIPKTTGLLTNAQKAQPSGQSENSYAPWVYFKAPAPTPAFTTPLPLPPYTPTPIPKQASELAFASIGDKVTVDSNEWWVVDKTAIGSQDYALLLLNGNFPAEPYAILANDQTGSYETSSIRATLADTYKNSNWPELKACAVQAKGLDTAWSIPSASPPSGASGQDFFFLLSEQEMSEADKIPNSTAGGWLREVGVGKGSSVEAKQYSSPSATWVNAGASKPASPAIWVRMEKASS